MAQAHRNAKSSVGLETLAGNCGDEGKERGGGGKEGGRRSREEGKMEEYDVRGNGEGRDEGKNEECPKNAT